MEHWWYRNIVEPGKLPLLLALLAFLAAFAVVRAVTHLIRAGRGPFRNVSSGGVHVHHAVPGLLLMVAGGFVSVATGVRGWVALAGAVAFGVGVGLVLDEFALILYLHDVYWSPRGRQSVEVVVLTAAVVSVFLAGALPLGVEDVSPRERTSRAWGTATVLGHFACALVALAKGKPRLTLLGVVVPLVAPVAAVRLARPGSLWDTRCYRRRPRARERAELRARRSAARWATARRRLGALARRGARGEHAEREGPERRE